MNKDNNTYNLIKFLIKKRKATKGLLSPVYIKLGDFPKYYLTNGKEITDHEYLLKIIDDLKLISDDYDKNNFKIVNKNVLNNLYKQDKGLSEEQKEIKICFKYARKELEEYEKENEIGDGVRKKNNKTEPLENLPENFSWDDVEIKISSENGSEIEIYINNTFITRTNHIRCGCYKNEDKILDIQWDFLNLLAISLENKKEATKGQFMEALKKNENSIEQMKSKLSAVLETLFNKQNPFHTYNIKKGYIPRFKLIPKPSLRKSRQEPYIAYNKPKFNEEQIPDLKTTTFSEVDGVGTPDK
jgi:hypothetical protein